MTPIDPFRLTPPSLLARARRRPPGRARQAALARVNHEIARANREAIDGADAVLAVLDGTDVDSGTAAEIGYAFARGKRIVGYRGDVRVTGDNEGAVVNLQVEYFVRASGGTIAARLSGAVRALRTAGSSSSRRTR